MQNDTVVRIGALELRFLIDETRSAGALVMFEFVVPTGARVPAPHFHRSVDEAVYGLAGTLTTTVDGQRHEIGPGKAALVPRGSVHHHENLHGETARALVVLTPGSIGRCYFEEVAKVVDVPGPPDAARMAEVMRRHGLVPA
jgi:quercetin dioxygenase-like cupin family protein